MKNSTFWNILVYLAAFFLLVLSSPFIVILFVSKFFEVVCTYIIDSFSENRVSAFFIKKRNEAILAEDGEPKEPTEDE